MQEEEVQDPAPERGGEAAQEPGVGLVCQPGQPSHLVGPWEKSSNVWLAQRFPSLYTLGLLVVVVYIGV